MHHIGVNAPIIIIIFIILYYLTPQCFLTFICFIGHVMIRTLLLILA